MQPTYQRLRRSVFLALSANPAHRASRYVTASLIILIVVGIVSVIISSVKEVWDVYRNLIVDIDQGILAAFSLEYVLRLWCCVENPKYAHPFFGRLRYILSPLALIDLAAITPALLVGIGVDLRTLRIARLIRLVRAFKVVRYIHALQVIGEVVHEKRSQLITSLSFVLFILVGVSTIMYEIENPVQPDAFSSIPATMWWAVASLTTVGYGDVYPITTAGKVLAAISAVLGIGLFAIPTGILASGFAEHALTKSEQRSSKQTEESTCPHCGKALY